MPLPGTMDAPGFGIADVSNFIGAYNSLSSRTRTDPAAEDGIPTFRYYCSEMIHKTIKMMNGYLRKDWVQLKEERKNALQHGDCRVYIYTRSYLEQLCSDQLEHGNVSLKAFMIAYDNISRIMINKGPMAEYSQVEMFLCALPRDLRAKGVMKLELDPINLAMFKYDELQKYIFHNCASTYALTLLDSEGARTAAGVSPYPILPGVPVPQLPVVVNLPAIPSEATLVLVTGILRYQTQVQVQP